MAADTFRVYEIDFGFVFKIPLVDNKNEISFSSEYCILMAFIKSTLICCLDTINFIEVSVFVCLFVFFTYTFEFCL